MINLKSLQRLAQPSTVPPVARCIVFDGQSAVSMARALEGAPWWAGVPCPQPGVSHPVPVPVDAIKSHLLRSRHLMVNNTCLHNGAGLRTDWPAKHACAEAAQLLPVAPEGEPVAQCQIVLDDLDRVAIAAARHDVRYFLCGVLLDFEHGALVATNGARLHCLRGGVPMAGRAGQVIVPVEAVKWLLHSRDDVADVSVWRDAKGGAQVLMRTSDAFVCAAGLTGQFPEWQRVVPALETCGARFGLEPGALAGAVESMGKLCKLETQGKAAVVTLDVSDGRVYAGEGPHFHALDMAVDTGPGEAVPLMLSAEYLQDAADCVSPGARWALPRLPAEGAVGPVLVVDGDFTAVVMPTRHPAPKDAPAPAAPPADAAGEPEAEAEPEPCPAAVAAMTAQLVDRAKAGAMGAPKARKGRQSRKAEPVEA